MQHAHGFIRAVYALKPQHSTIARRVISAAAIESPLKKVVPAEPGSVKPYDHHLFLEVAGDKSIDWPSKAEALPILIRAFGALAKHKDSIRGTVKVTAFVSPQDPSAQQESGCTAVIFPAGTLGQNIEASELEHLSTHISHPIIVHFYLKRISHC